MEYLIGIIGIVLGVFLNEIIRRKNRIEELNKQLFNIRLEKYLELYNLVFEQYSKLSHVIEEFKSWDNHKKHEYISDLVFSIVVFNDSRSFFLSDEITIQTSTLFMGIEDVKENEFDNAYKTLQSNYKKTIQMIKDESGINQVNQNYKNILKYNHKSDVIDYYNKIKKEYNNN